MNVQRDASRAPILPRRCPGAFTGWSAGLNALGTVWIIALMLLINADVIGRNLLNAPVRGVTELVSLSIVGIVFLQLADTLHSGRFTRADVLLERLKRSRPVGRGAAAGGLPCVGALLMAVILWAAWAPLVESIRIREYVGAIGDFTAPVWPVRLIMLVGPGRHAADLRVSGTGRPAARPGACGMGGRACRRR